MTCTSHFSFSEAKTADLFTKDTYIKYARILIGHRAFTLGARDIGGDLLMGVMETTELKIVENVDLSPDDYEIIDYTFYNLITNLEKELKKYEETKIKDENFEELYKLNFIIKNSNGGDIELKPDGEKISVTYDNLKDYIYLAKKLRTNEFLEQIEYIKSGFNSVISSSIFQVLNWRQLEEMVCGKNKLDVRDLKKHTKYEGFNANDEVIKWFWEWLEECDDHEQSLYLKFVSGRARLPKEKDFNYQHIIVKNDYNNSEALPHSATCFFTLKLPSYKDKETLKKKLKYSILNCDEIDGDH